MCVDIAALLNPMPAPADGGDESGDESYSRAAGAAWQEREETAEGLRMSWAEEDIDPLLSTLTSLRNRRLQLEADMRLLIAYGRCFTHPRPYKLIDLANAAGMSISGIRTAYDTDEIDQAAEILKRPPAAPQQPSGNGLGPRRHGRYRSTPATASITTGRMSPCRPPGGSWLMARANEGIPHGLPERPAAEPGPGRIELQPATAGYNTGSSAELTPGQARAVAPALPGARWQPGTRRRGVDARATCRACVPRWCGTSFPVSDQHRRHIYGGREAAGEGMVAGRSSPRGAGGPDRGRPEHAGGRHRARMARGRIVLRSPGAGRPQRQSGRGPRPALRHHGLPASLTPMAGTRPAR
jgi:hypothetical protein